MRAPPFRSLGKTHDEGPWRSTPGSRQRLLPRDYGLLFNLGMLLAQSDRTQEASSYLRRFVAEAPSDRYGADVQRVRTTLERMKPDD
ncbi:MAG: hypothetical protein HYX76_03525 [Acidobacteria bacterium]|nr:hypothetical protein [Acidobacteriota bacterium]